MEPAAEEPVACDGDGGVYPPGLGEFQDAPDAGAVGWAPDRPSSAISSTITYPCLPGKKASSTHKMQAAAQKAATKQAKSATKGQVVVHRPNGQIRTEHTYGSDPHPPKG